MAKAEFSFNRPSGVGDWSSGGGGGGAGRGGGPQGGGKRRDRALPAVKAVVPKPKSGWGGGGRARGGRTGVVFGEEVGSDSDGDGLRPKKARSGSESESEMEGRAGSAAMRRAFKGGLAVSFAGAEPPAAALGGERKEAPSPLLAEYSPEDISERLGMLNNAVDSTVNAKTLPGLSVGELAIMDKVLAALQCEVGGENRKDLGWRYESLVKACEVGAPRAPRAVLPG